MLSEADEHLLAAAVDGELSPDRMAVLTELLARSPAAARLYASLTADRDRLASLPRASAPATLWADLFARIQLITPAVRPAPRRPNWTPMAMAASFLLAVAAGSYWLAASQQPQRAVALQVQQLPQVDLPSSSLPLGPAAAEPESMDVRPSAALPPAAASPAAVETARAADSPVTPMLSPDQLLTARPVTAVRPFDRVDVKLPLLLSAGDLTHDDAQTSLREQIARNIATRIDLFVRDPARAAEVLSQAGRGVNLNVVVETIAGERMKRKMPSTWAVYADSLTPAEVVKWLSEAAAADAKAASVSGGLFGSLHVVAAGGPEQKDVQLLLGIDLGKKQADASAHISAKTLDQVTSAIQKGESPRPAILLTYLPALGRVHPALSKDVRQFHELRKDRKSGTAVVLLVIRPMS